MVDAYQINEGVPLEWAYTFLATNPPPAPGTAPVQHRRRHPALGTAVHWALLFAALAYAAHQAPALFRSVQDGGRWVHQLRWGWAGVGLVLVLLSIAATRAAFS